MNSRAILTQIPSVKHLAMDLSTEAAIEATNQGLNLPEVLKELEKDTIIQAFLIGRNSVSETARILGLSRTKVNAVLKAANLRAKDLLEIEEGKK